MLLLFRRGALESICRHVQLKGNVYYYRRRIPEDVRSLHRHQTTRKPQEQLFFSLKTSDKLEACRKADSHTRRFDALWKAHREGLGPEANPAVSLATLEAAKLSPGDGKRYRDSPPNRRIHRPSALEAIESLLCEEHITREGRRVTVAHCHKGFDARCNVAQERVGLFVLRRLYRRTSWAKRREKFSTRSIPGAVADFVRLFAERENEERATTQVAQAARAAPFGAVGTMLINMDSVTPGWVDEETGEVAFEAEGGAGGYGVIDEIAGRVLANGGRVLAVCRGDIPQRAELAAVPRYTT